MTIKLLKIIKFLWVVLFLTSAANLVWADSANTLPPNAIAYSKFSRIQSDQKWFQLEFNEHNETLYRGQKILGDDGTVLFDGGGHSLPEIIATMLADGYFPAENCDMADVDTNGIGGCWFGYSCTGLNPKKLIAAIVKKPSMDICAHGHFGWTWFPSEEIRIRDFILKRLAFQGELRFENLWVMRDMFIHGSIRGQPLACRDFKLNGYGVIYRLSARNIYTEGYLAVRQAKIRQNVYIAGRLEAHDLEVGRDLRVIGSASLTRAKLRSGHISLTGAFPIKFTDVNVKSDLTFGRESYCHKPLVIVIDGKSTINGSIIFKTPGKLLLGSRVKIKGKIHNAAIQQHEKERLNNL